MKSDWLIATTNGKFLIYRETLKALGYKIHQYTQEADVNNRDFIGLLRDWGDQVVQRTVILQHGTKIFPDMESFLDFHFQKEKTREEKELDKLNQQLVELQAQINVVKQSINK